MCRCAKKVVKILEKRIRSGKEAAQCLARGEAVERGQAKPLYGIRRDIRAKTVGWMLGKSPIAYKLNTQPLRSNRMYKMISQHRLVRRAFAAHESALGGVLHDILNVSLLFPVDHSLPPMLTRNDAIPTTTNAECYRPGVCTIRIGNLSWLHARSMRDGRLRKMQRVSRHW